VSNIRPAFHNTADPAPFDAAAIERLKAFILADDGKRMPAAVSAHPCDGIILYVLELEEELRAT